MITNHLPKLEKQINQERVDRYARVSGDFNPIHVDPEYAANTDYGQTIAHGMLTLAFVSEMMFTTFPDAWIRGGKLRARFKSPVFSGDTLTTFGTLKSSTVVKQSTWLEYTVGCLNQRGETVISGNARVTVPSEI